jgi:2-polyprenyl-3-methyl-5-hydroxy-6-metoxy-1,4-benzoquinol methylase
VLHLTHQTPIEQVGFVRRTRCDLCGSNQQTVLLSKAFTEPVIADFLEVYYGGRIDRTVLAGAAYTVVKCQSCGFMWQQDILNDAGMQALYNVWIAPEESLQKRRENGSSSYARQAAVIGALLPHMHAGDIQVLDFGMGWGYWCAAVQAAGYRVTGLELSAERIRFARAMRIEVIERLDGRRFDFINAEQVFEHIPAPLETLRQLVSHLNPSGIIHIAVPDSVGIERKLARPDWKPSADAALPLEHINCFTRRTLVRLGEAAGLRVITPPLMLTRKYGWKSLARGVAARYYRQFFGTGLYFKVNSNTKI